MIGQLAPVRAKLGYPQSANLMKRIRLIIAILVLAAAGGTAWWLLGGKRPPHQLVLYGDVDLRQVDLAFNDSGPAAQRDAVASRARWRYHKSRRSRSR